MPEEGTLSIVRRAQTYQVCYASYHPYAMDRQPYACTDQEHLGAFLRQLGIEPWYITQACADLGTRGFTALPIVLSAAQMQVWFPPIGLAP